MKSLACEPLSQTWVIATLRSDFYAPLAHVPELAELKGGLGQYDLPSPGPAEIALLVREPAAAAGLRFEQDPDGQRLDDVLRDEASQDASLLPLLEFTLNELYDAPQRPWQADLRGLSGHGRRERRWPSGRNPRSWVFRLKCRGNCRPSSASW